MTSRILFPCSTWFIANTIMALTAWYFPRSANMWRIIVLLRRLAVPEHRLQVKAPPSRSAEEVAEFRQEFFDWAQGSFSCARAAAASRSAWMLTWKAPGSGRTKKEGGGVKVPIRVWSPFSACVYLIEPKSKETVIDSTLCEMLTPKERKQRKRGIRVVGLWFVCMFCQNIFPPLRGFYSEQSR